MVAAVDGGRRLADVRAWWRVRHPPASLGQRLDFAYSVAIMAGIFGALAYGTASSALAQVVTPDWLAVFGPSLSLLAVLVAMHWGAYQGPVVFSVADVAFLLGAPLPRRGLAVRRLALALTCGAAAGALAAGVVIVGLAGEGRGIAGDRAVAVAVGLAELGVLMVAGAWAVERSAGFERAARRALWLAALAAAALAAASDAGRIGRAIALWSGPWGWAAQPAAGRAWLPALVVLTFVTALAAGAAVRSCGDCPAERHLRRAEARASAIASLAGYDLRTARRALETVGRSGGGRRGRGLGRVRSARLAVPWRDFVVATRTPGRVVEGAVLAAAGTVLGVLNADRAVALVVAMLLVYFGAARMLWPLRAELDVPDRMQVLLRPRSGRVLGAHAIVPALVATGAAALAAAGCALAGAGGGAALAAVAVAPAVTCCAGMAARREGRLPPSLMVNAVAADPSGGLGALLAWFTFWPSVAAALGAGAIALVTSGGAVAAAVLIVVATAGLARLLARDVPATSG